MTTSELCVCDAPELRPGFEPGIYLPHPALRWVAAPSELVLVCDAWGSVTSHPLRYDRDSGVVTSWANIDVAAITGELPTDDDDAEFIVDASAIAVEAVNVGDTLYVTYFVRAQGLTKVTPADPWAFELPYGGAA